MLFLPLLLDSLRGLDRLELVQSIPQHDQAPALLVFLGKVQDVDLPILLGEYLVRSVFQSPKIEHAEELPALQVIEIWRAVMGEELVGVHRPNSVAVLGDFLRKTLAGQITRWRRDAHFEEARRVGVCQRAAVDLCRGASRRPTRRGRRKALLHGVVGHSRGEGREARASTECRPAEQTARRGSSGGKVCRGTGCRS